MLIKLCKSLDSKQYWGYSFHPDCSCMNIAFSLVFVLEYLYSSRHVIKPFIPSPSQWCWPRTAWFHTIINLWDPMRFLIIRVVLLNGPWLFFYTPLKSYVTIFLNVSTKTPAQGIEEPTGFLPTAETLNTQLSNSISGTVGTYPCIPRRIANWNISFNFRFPRGHQRALMKQSDRATTNHCKRMGDAWGTKQRRLYNQQKL